MIFPFRPRELKYANWWTSVGCGFISTARANDVMSHFEIRQKRDRRGLDDGAEVIAYSFIET